VQLSSWINKGDYYYYYYYYLPTGRPLVNPGKCVAEPAPTVHTSEVISKSQKMLHLKATSYRNKKTDPS